MDDEFDEQLLRGRFYGTESGEEAGPEPGRVYRELLTVRLGASYLHTGLREGRTDLQERGHLALARMTARPACP